MGKPNASDPEPGSNDTWIRRMRFPVVSGKASAALVIVCLVLTGLIVIPLAKYFDLPVWLRFEILLGVWWVVWVAVLARLLYTGHHVSDDHALGPPRNWVGNLFGSNRGSSSTNRSSGGWGWWVDPWPGDLEGCVMVLGFILAVIVAIVGFWVLIEIAIPGILFVLYMMVRGMLARVANDNHSCKDDAVKAISWSCVWATLYVAPLALLVWLGHVIMAARQG